MAEQKNALMSLIKEKRETLEAVFPTYMKHVNYDVYLKRSLISIFEDKNLTRISQTKAGAFSLYMCILHASEVGLQIGGLNPQAYIVSFGEEAVLIPSAAGYRFIVKVDDPVLEDYVQKAVYDGDDCHIDAMSGEVKHKITITDKKRKLIGVYAVFVELNGTRHADYISRGEIEEIRDKWSKQPKGKAWENSFNAMAMNKAAKHFLKPYAEQKEALRRTLAIADGEPVHDSRPIQDRVSDKLDGILDAEFEPAESTPPQGGSGVPPKADKDQAPDQKEQKKGNAPF